MPATHHLEDGPVSDASAEMRDVRVGWRSQIGLQLSAAHLSIREAPDAVENSPTVPNERMAIHMAAPHAPPDGGGIRSSSRIPGGELRENTAAHSCPMLPQVLEYAPNRKVAVDKLSILFYSPQPGSVAARRPVPLLPAT